MTILVADNSLLAGETSLVTFTFNEAVTGFTNSDLIIPSATLTPVASLDGGVTWTATLTPLPNIIDPTNKITVRKALITDLAGIPGVGNTGSNNYAINTL